MAIADLQRTYDQSLAAVTAAVKAGKKGSPEFDALMEKKKEAAIVLNAAVRESTPKPAPRATPPAAKK